MTNYRRLISYIYAYEGEVKGKNIGFAKLESRNGQCKLSINVKKVYVESSDLGVYLLVSGKEVFLGSIFIRSGCGELRAVVNVEDVIDSDCSMDQCYGLTIHEQEDTWRAYITIREDAVVYAAGVELADVTSSKLGDAEVQIHRKVEEPDQESRSGGKASEDGDGPVLSGFPAEARQMRAAGKQSDIQESSLKRAVETMETVQEAEVSAGTPEEVFQVEDEVNQTVESGQRTEVLEQAVEKTIGAEEIVSESVEAESAEMSEDQSKQGGSVRQNNQESGETTEQMETSSTSDAGGDLAPEPELLLDTEDRMELEPESLPGGIQETQESGDISGSRLERQSEKETEPEKTVVLRNRSPAGIIPTEDVEQMDGMMTPNVGGEQESDRGAWKDKQNLGERQKP